MSSQTNIYPAKTHFFLGSVFLLISLLFCFKAQAEDHWQPIAPGLEYQGLEGGILTPWSHVYAFRVDLKQNQLGIASARSFNLPNASVDQLAEQSKALLSINGGFFDQQFKPLGLRINNHSIENRIKAISWWGVFYVQDQKAHISSMSRFSHNSDISFAIQAGPRVLIKGESPSLKQGVADRTALGITKDGAVIILVSTNAAMTTEELANLMKSPPLYCTDALNLDGGSSSQLYARVNSFKLNVRGFSNVSDAIIVKPL